MKRNSLLVLVLMLGLPLNAQKPLGDATTELAKQISTSATRQEKQKIAVLPFQELDGEATEFGRYVAEALVTNLFQLGNFKIVERQLLGTVLGELKVQQSGAIDPATAKEIGRIAAVDAIVTGSITEMEKYVAIHCRLIDTTTGEVFGAAQTSITKDEDVKRMMRFILTDTGIGGEPRKRLASGVLSKDAGSVRVSIKSLRLTTDGIMCTLEILNREARKSILVALNAAEWEAAIDQRARYQGGGTPLRASLQDERGGTWSTSSAGVTGIGYVRAGVHGRNGREAYNPNDVPRLLRLRDTLGRDKDDPADGVMAKANSIGEGGRNTTYGDYGNTSPEQFFPNRENTFVSGTLTPIDPGDSITVTMRFAGGASPASVFQWQGEIVIGVRQPNATTTYMLHNLIIDHIGAPKD